MICISTQTAMAELLPWGCTSSSDHLCISPHGVSLDDSMDAARKIGMRFIATHGSMRHIAVRAPACGSFNITAVEAPR